MCMWNKTEAKENNPKLSALFFFYCFPPRIHLERLFLLFVMLDENLNGELILGYKSGTYLVHTCLCHGIIFSYEHNCQEKIVKASSYFLLHQAILFGFLTLFEFQLFNQVSGAQY